MLEGRTGKKKSGKQYDDKVQSRDKAMVFSEQVFHMAHTEWFKSS